MDFVNIRAMMAFTDVLQNDPNKAYECFKDLAYDFKKDDLVNIISELLLSLRENVDDNFHYLYNSILADVQIELDEKYDAEYETYTDWYIKVQKKGEMECSDIKKEKEIIYNEIREVLLRYEESDDDESDLLYEMLTKIQCKWKDLITVDI